MYRIYLDLFIDGEYQQISNVVEYQLPEGPSAQLELLEDHTVRRTEVVDDNGEVLRWAIEYDGEVVLKRNARDEMEYRYFSTAPGVYRIYLDLFIDGEYQQISNVVEYQLLRRRRR